MHSGYYHDEPVGYAQHGQDIAYAASHAPTVKDADNDSYIYPPGCSLKGCQLHPERLRNSGQNYPERTVDNIQLTSRATSTTKSTYKNVRSDASTDSKKKKKHKDKHKDRELLHKHGGHHHQDIKPPRHVDVGAVRFNRESKESYMKRNGLHKHKHSKSHKSRHSQTGEDDTPHGDKKDKKKGKREKVLTSKHKGVTQLAHSTMYVPRKPTHSQDPYDDLNGIAEEESYESLNHNYPYTSTTDPYFDEQNTYHQDGFFKPTNAQFDPNPERTIRGFVNPDTGSYYPLPRALSRVTYDGARSLRTLPSNRDDSRTHERISPSEKASIVSEYPTQKTQTHNEPRVSSDGRSRLKGVSDHEDYGSHNQTKYDPAEDDQESKQEKKKSCCVIS